CACPLQQLRGNRLPHVPLPAPPLLEGRLQLGQCFAVHRSLLLTTGAVRCEDSLCAALSAVGYSCRNGSFRAPIHWLTRSCTCMQCRERSTSTTWALLWPS